MNCQDVIVIGAGPAGTIVAEQIASEGFDVLILEKANFPGHRKYCGGALSKEFCRELDLPNVLVEGESDNLVFHYPRDTIRLTSKSGFVLFEREKFDSFLAMKAEEKGAKLFNSTVVTDVIRNGNMQIVQFKRISLNQKEKIQARLVIFADGAETFAYKKYNIGFQPKPDCTMLAATCDLRSYDKPNNSLDFFISNEISPHGYGWVFPRKQAINVGVTVLLSKMKHNIRFYLNQLLKSENIEKLQSIKSGFRLIPQLIVDNLHTDTTMVVGDAAGTADPITGKGISNAIVNAKIAAKVATKALKNKTLTADLLAEYQEKWKATLEYQGIVNKYKLHRLALKIGINPAISLKLGAFGSFESLDLTDCKNNKRTK